MHYATIVALNNYALIK